MEFQFVRVLENAEVIILNVLATFHDFVGFALVARRHVLVHACCEYISAIPLGQELIVVPERNIHLVAAHVA